MEIDLPFASSLPTWEQWSGLSLVKARAWNSIQISRMCAGDPSPWTNIRYLHTSSGSWVGGGAVGIPNQCSWDDGIEHGGLTYCPSALTPDPEFRGKAFLCMC